MDNIMKENNENDLISRQAIIEKMQNHRKLFCKNHIEYSILSKDEKARVDEIDNCIACLFNEPKVESELKWISASERLPKKEIKSYWVCTDTKYQCECRWTNNIYGIGESNDWGWKIFDIPQYTKVIAWMPLPPSYQGK